MEKSSVLEGVGASPCANGVAFRVWAPHASQVWVVGTFNNWNGHADPMASEPRGYWHAFVQGAEIGDPYRYRLCTEWDPIRCIDSLPVSSPWPQTPGRSRPT